MKAKIEKKAHRPSLADRVVALVEEARRKVAGAANVALVYTYYEIGRMIVEEEQGGQKRAGYGEAVSSFKRIIREERLAHENRLLLTDSHKESSR